MSNLLKGLSASLAILLILTGCSKEASENKIAELEKIQEKVAKSVNSAESYTKEKIEKATSYIKNNIDKIEDGDVAKKLAEYGYYLENVAKNSETEVSHDLAKLGKETSDLAEKVYVADDDEKDDIIKNAKETFSSWETKLSKEKDKLVDEFYDLINN